VDLAAPCRSFSRARMKSLVGFLTEHKDVLARLEGGRQDTYVRLCGYVSHLRSQKAVRFYMQTLQDIEKLGTGQEVQSKLRGALILAARNWGTVGPYFSALKALDTDESFLEEWVLFARVLADADIDVALTFLRYTPRAVSVLGEDEVIHWGARAMHAVESLPALSKASCAYLEESVANRCATTPERWEFNLRQAARIASQSPDAAEEFIRSGGRICLLLDEEEAAAWVGEGLERCGTADELSSYFSGRSLSALEARDGLMSGIALKDRQGALLLICEAYLGRTVRIRSNRRLVGVPGFSGGSATDGRIIYLPEIAESFPHLKLMALHQATLLDELDRTGNGEASASAPVALHLKVDRILLERLPGLITDMRRLVRGDFPTSYPSVGPRWITAGMPWWGELLPHLVEETESNARRIKAQLTDYDDIPPEFLEALMDSLLTQGDRDPDSLMSRLMKLLDSVDFQSPDAEQLEESVKTYLYKEWDMELGDYKLEWCLVRERLAPDNPNSFVEELREKLHGIIGLIRRQFVKLRPERFKKFKAQPYGDDLDIDALVETIVEARSGSFLSENIYIRRDKRIRDVAVLFLLDMSGSTEERVSGKRVIDIEKESMALMAEALDSLEDPFAIYGFSTEGRFRVDMFSVKSFSDPYDEHVRYRLGNLEPGNLTRMGAVLRHATSKLEQVQAKVKLMVIMTDGRPYDMEYGRLDYAIADTAKAFKEARRSRIHPFIITSDKQGVTYLRRICSQTQSIILPKVELLPKVLPALYRRLTA
jgi:von Willebrand factor type A domain